MNSRGHNKGQYGLDGKVVVEKKMKAPPRARTCHICGRNYMIHSFGIHLPQCQKLFEDREMLKPPRERRAVPADPMKTMMVEDPDQFSGGVNLQHNLKQLDALNKQANQAYSEDVLDKCENCGRTFISGKLEKHQKMCKASNPMRPVAGAKSSSSSSRSSSSRGVQPGPAKKKAPGLSVKVGIGVVKFVEARSAPRESAPAWKSKSESFRLAVRRAKMISKAELQVKEVGGSSNIEDYLPPGFKEQGDAEYAAMTADYAECPTCYRTFAPRVAERHIPACAKMKAKPGRLMKGSGTSVRSSSAPLSPSNVMSRNRESYPDMIRQTSRPTATVDKGINRGPDAQAALLRAKLAKQKAGAQRAPMDGFLGRSAPGYAGSSMAARDRERRMRSILPGEAHVAPNNQAADGAVAMTGQSMATHSGAELRKLIQARHTKGNQRAVKRF